MSSGLKNRFMFPLLSNACMFNIEMLADSLKDSASPFSSISSNACCVALTVKWTFVKLWFSVKLLIIPFSSISHSVAL